MVIAFGEFLIIGKCSPNMADNSGMPLTPARRTVLKTNGLAGLAATFQSGTATGQADDRERWSFDTDLSIVGSEDILHSMSGLKRNGCYSKFSIERIYRNVSRVFSKVSSIILTKSR